MSLPRALLLAAALLSVDAVASPIQTNYGTGDGSIPGGAMPTGNLLSTHLLSATRSGTGNAYFYQEDSGNTVDLARLYDGQFGPGWGDPSYSVMPNVVSLTFNLNLAASPSGYDLTSIRTYASWDDGRDGQAYTVEYSAATNPGQFSLLATVSRFDNTNFPQIPNPMYGMPNPMADYFLQQYNWAVMNNDPMAQMYWDMYTYELMNNSMNGPMFFDDTSQSSTMVRLTGTSGLLASGVAALRFNFAGVENAGTGFREFIVEGVAGPAPSTVTSTVGDLSGFTNAGVATFEGGRFAPTSSAGLPDILVAAGFAGTLDATAADIASSGAVTIAGTSLTLTGSATSTISLAGDISGAGILINAGGDNILSGTNTCAGIAVTGGSLRIASSAALPSGNNSVSGGGTLIVGANLNVSAAVSIAGDGAAGQLGALVFDATIGGGNALTVTLSDDARVGVLGAGQVYVGGAFNAASAGRTLTIDTGSSMFLPDGGIGANIAHVIKEGSGMLYLRSSIVGDVTVNAGTFYAGFAASTGSAVTVNAGGNLFLCSEMGTPVNFAAPVTLAGSQTLRFGSYAALTQSGQITVAADSSIVSDSADNVISGGIVGATPGQHLTLQVDGYSLALTGVTGTSIAQLTKDGAGALLVDANGVIKSASVVVAGGLLTNNGSIDGAVTVATGATLKGSGSVAGPITIAGVGAAGQAGALVLEAPTAGSLNSSNAVLLSGDAKVALNGAGQHYHAGLIAAASPGKTLTIDTGAGMFYPDGGIGANVAHVVKDGGGMLYLRAAVAGDVTINAGSYHAGVAGATGAGVTVNAGASLRLNSDWGTPIDFVAPLTLSGAGALQINPVAPITQSGAITLAADSSIESGSQDNVISGAIAGATPGRNLGLVVYDHTLKLTGVTAASIAEVTKTGAGTLLIDATAVLDAGSVVIADGLLTNNGSISGTISVTGTGVLGGSGTLNGSVTINGVLAPGNSPGIQVQAAGDTTLTAGSRFQAQLGGTTAGNGDGFHDQYDVQAGRLNLDPGVTLEVLSWVKADGVTTFVPARRDVFTVIRTSGGIAGVFADITNANYSQWMLYDNAPSLHALGKLYGTGLNGNQTFADYASTPARAAIGASLWAAAVTASNSSTGAHPAGFIDGDTAFGRIVIALLTAPDADAFLGGLSPDAYLAVGNYALTVSRSLTEAAFAQSSLIRSGAWTVGAGYNRAQHGYVGAFSPGYDLSSDTSLFTAAYDFGAHCSVGFFFGQNRGKTAAAESRIDYRGSVFGLTSVGRIPGAYPVTLKGALIASDLELDANRSGSVSGAQGLRSLGGQLMAAVELYKDGRLTLSPTLGFVHGRSTAGAFAETGSGANLTITNIDQESSRLIAGFGLTYLASTNLTFELSAAFEHEYAGDAGSVGATFGGVGDPMTKTRAIEDRDSTTCGLGASWRLDRGTTVRLGAEVRGNRELSKDYRYNASVNVRF